MTFESILDLQAKTGAGEAAAMPEYFRELNLDQVVNAIAAAREEYDLKPFFYASLDSLDAIAYRHEVMRDLENARAVDCVTCFADSMRQMRRNLQKAANLHDKRQKERWFLRPMTAARTSPYWTATISHLQTCCWPPTRGYLQRIRAERKRTNRNRLRPESRLQDDVRAHLRSSRCLKSV